MRNGERKTSNTKILNDGWTRMRSGENPIPGRSMFRLFGDLQSRRDCIIQPRVATNELPWVISRETSPTLKGLNHAELVPRTWSRA